MRIADQLQVDCPVFYIDNVAEYVETLDQEKWSNAVSGDLSEFSSFFPCAAPPFERFFVEWKYLSGSDVLRFAVLFRAFHGPQGWIVVGEGYLWDSDEREIRKLRLPSLLISLDGEVVGFPDTDAFLEPEFKILRVFLFESLLAISFMHCKNVRRVENVPPFNRARRRRGEREWLKFYTLEIDPMKEVLRREGRIDEVGLKRALHICRGHFATYSGAGLFGKYPGTFWRPSHVRGTAEVGVNVKDYSVKAPRR